MGTLRADKLAQVSFSFCFLDLREPAIDQGFVSASQG